LALADLERNSIVHQPASNATPGRIGSWFEERVGISALYQKYGRKAFPVHSTYFFGEMAAFSFIILMLTGVYLGFMYVPSNSEVTIAGETMPEAYASILLIESIPVASLFRNVHHWAAHLMVVSILLHLIRIYFTGTYRKPREINWIIGIGLLTLTLAAGFIGYSLPYDSYAVTATGIGYSIARSIPWIGGPVSELVFGGNFPTLGSIPRLYTIHVFILPALLIAVMSLHMLLVVKQKHTQPGYARKLAEPGRVLGVPMWPYQALLAGQLLMLMFGALFLLSVFVTPHAVQNYGPPGVTTPEVKAEWYVMWMYGLLEIIPASWSFNIFGATIQPNFLGGVVFPGVLFTLVAMVPFLDRTNRKAIKRFEYSEPPRQSPVRLALGTGVLALLGALILAGFSTDFDWSLRFTWLMVLSVPAVATGLVWLVSTKTYKDERFDPTSEDAPAITSPHMDEFGNPAYQSLNIHQRLDVTFAEAQALILHLEDDERAEAIAELDQIRKKMERDSYGPEWE
jgi:cytochrome b-561